MLLLSTRAVAIMRALEAVTAGCGWRQLGSQFISACNEKNGVNEAYAEIWFAIYIQQRAASCGLPDDAQYTYSNGPRPGSCWMMRNIQTVTGGELGAAGWCAIYRQQRTTGWLQHACQCRWQLSVCLACTKQYSSTRNFPSQTYFLP